jgi:hypothetical protein
VLGAARAHHARRGRRARAARERRRRAAVAIRAGWAMPRWGCVPFGREDSDSLL